VITSNALRKRLLDMLRERSYRRGEFTLASGRKSDFFIDCKRTVLSPDGHAIAGLVVLEEVEAISAERPVNGLVAVPLGGCPLAGSACLAAFQRGLRFQLIYVRPERKDHGTGQRVEGADVLPRGARVVLIEDVVTSGGSSLRAVEALREAGLEVATVVVLVDRKEGGRELLAEHGLKLRAIFTRDDFIPPTTAA
jgi:orotate phosphoribosyltransferase